MKVPSLELILYRASVGLKLWNPTVLIRGGNSRTATSCMLVPEVAIDKDDLASRRENHVRFSRKILEMNSVEVADF